MTTMEKTEEPANRSGIRAPALFVGFPSPMLLRDDDYTKALRRFAIHFAPREGSSWRPPAFTPFVRCG
jgi:hypothetical protein